MFVIFSFSAISCSDFSPEESFQNVNQSPIIISTHIPNERALIALREFTDNLKQDTRTNRNRSFDVKSSTSVGFPKSVKVRSDEEEEYEDESDDLLYFMEFEDGGYAILSADTNVQEDIIAVVEDGSLSQEEVTSILGNIGSVEYPEFEETPDLSYLSLCSRDSIGNWINADGEYVNPFNPASFPLYDSIQCDHLSGNFTDDIIAIDSSSRDSLDMSPKSMLVRISFNWAVDRYIKNLTHSTEEEAPNLENNQVSTTVNEYSTPVANMLQGAMACWHQSAPFNNQCPTVRHPLLFWKKRTALCGCVVLALGEMMAVMEFPTPSPGVNHPSWYAIRNINVTNDSNPVASDYIKGISQYCKPLYFWGGTFVFPKMAKKALERMGFSNVKYQYYSTNHVLNTLEDGCPVFVCSIPSQDNDTFIYIPTDLPNSHAWVIDGYKKKETYEIISTYNDGVMTSSDRRLLSSSDYVHCVFGWGGNYNGYFLNGVFDFMSNETAFDNPNTTSTSLFYSYYLKTITFDNPY